MIVRITDTMIEMNDGVETYNIPSLHAYKLSTVSTTPLVVDVWVDDVDDFLAATGRSAEDIISLRAS